MRLPAEREALRFEQSFVLPVGVETVFAALTDVPVVASCMPAVTLTGAHGRRHAGTLTATLGPVTLTYHGQAWLDEVDDAGRTFRMVAAATEEGGDGNAGATVAGRVLPDGDGTRVHLDVDLQVAGRPAPFGRGLITDVSRGMTEQFAARLTARLDDLSAATAALAPTPPAGAPAAAGGDVLPERARRTVTVAAVVAAAVLAGAALRRRRKDA